MSLPIIAITMGDPAGVGPEIIVKALASPEIYDIGRPVVIGDAARLRRAAEICHLDVEVKVVEGPEEALYLHGVIDCIDLKCVPADLPFG